VWDKASPGLADLRVADASWSEVPHVVHARTGRSSREWRSTALSETGFVPGGYTQAVADVGEHPGRHNTLEVEIVERDFFAWAEIAASDDRVTWRIVRERAPVYRFEKDGLAGTGVVSYPETHARWLRLRLHAEDAGLTVRRLRVAAEEHEEPELVVLPVSAVRDGDAPRGESRFRAEFGDTGTPVGAVRFRTTRVLFHRPATIEVSNDGTTWKTTGTGDIYRSVARTEGSGAWSEQLAVRFGEARGRYWRITVADRNDPPIDDLAVELLGTPRHLLFQPSRAGAVHHMLYGNGRATAPDYELARLTTFEDREPARAVEAGPESENAAWVSPEPWTERHPVVLWVALVLAVGVLVVLALRALR
jgi:hypothetical protein